MTEKRKKVHVATLGCKVNQFESASFETGFTKAGCQLVSPADSSDLVVINTCAVTARAGQQSRQLIRRALRNHPGTRLVVTGCYAQIAAGEILEITAGKAIIIGNGNKDKLVTQALMPDQYALTMLMGDIGRKKEICHLPVRRFSGRTRAFLKIQDGCNNFCSYCIVPFTRGRCRSLPRQLIREQVEIFIKNGYRELVITGINVGKYGIDCSDHTDIYQLLSWLCTTWPDIRFRLSSIEPTEVNEQLLDLLTENANFMPHLHIPLQSGDDRILAQMRRRYTTADFSRAINDIHARLPHAAIGCDILVGFPGEDDAAVTSTQQLLRTLPIAYLHVFPYSRRPGTLADTLDDHVDVGIKDQRVKRFRRLDQNLRNRFRRRHLTSTLPVLVERRHRKSGLLQGFSPNYIQVFFAGTNDLQGQVVPVTLEKLAENGVLGSAA